MRSSELGVSLALAGALMAGCSSDRPDVDVSGLPDELPAAVAQALPGVVKILGEVQLDDRISATYGSGVRINDTQVLTAEHVLDMPLSCEGIYVDAPTQEASDYSDYYGRPVHGQRLTAEGPHFEAGGSDLALVNLASTESELLDPPPTTQIRDFEKEPLLTGEPLFIAGYGASDLDNPHDIDQRTPYEPALGPEQMADGYNTPWVVGAVVLGVSDEGRPLVVAGLRDYSHGKRRDEAASGHGDSGGPAYDTQGRLVALLSAGDTREDLEYIQNMAGVDLTGLPFGYDASHFAIAPIEPFTAQNYSDLPSQPCLPRDH